MKKKKYEIMYVNCAGEIRHITVKAESEDDARSKACSQQGNYSSDDIDQIISVTEL